MTGATPPSDDWVITITNILLTFLNLATLPELHEGTTGYLQSGSFTCGPAVGIKAPE